MRSSSGPGGSSGRGGAAEWVTWLDARVRVAEVVVLLVPVAATLGAFTIDESVRAAAEFSHADPSPVAAFTAHYVHRSAGHLRTNLLVYLSVVPIEYVLATLAARRRLFWVVFGSFLLVFPIVLSASSLLLFDRGTLVGFSAVALAFVGFLPVVLFRYLGSRFRGPFDLARAPGLFFAGVALIAAVAVPPGAIRLAIAAVAAGIGVAYLARPTGQFLGVLRGRGRGATSRVGAIELVALALVAYVSAVLLAFPAEIVRSGGVVNIYLHFLGFSLGFLASYITCRIDRAVVNL